MMLGACVLAYRTARRAGASSIVTLLTFAIALPCISVGAMPWRPAMFTLLFVPLLIAWLQCGRATWLIPLLFVLWANLHAGVVAGLAILGTHLIARPFTITRLALVTLLSAAAAFVLLAVAREKGLHRWLTLAVLAMMGFRQVRDVPLFGLAVVAMLPPVVEQFIARWREQSLPPRLRALPVVLPLAAAAVAAVIGVT